MIIRVSNEGAVKTSKKHSLTSSLSKAPTKTILTRAMKCTLGHCPSLLLRENQKGPPQKAFLLLQLHTTNSYKASSVQRRRKRASIWYSFQRVYYSYCEQRFHKWAQQRNGTMLVCFQATKAAIYSNAHPLPFCPGRDVCKCEVKRVKLCSDAAAVCVLLLLHYLILQQPTTTLNSAEKCPGVLCHIRMAEAEADTGVENGRGDQ